MSFLKQKTFAGSSFSHVRICSFFLFYAEFWLTDLKIHEIYELMLYLSALSEEIDLKNFL